jgi:Chromate transport protein ChrA
MILLKLYTLFLKLSFISFGGGYPLMSLIHKEAELAVGLSAEEFMDMAALELLASGPIAINAPTYIGYVKGGVLGAIVATIGICTSSYILAPILMIFLDKFKNSQTANAFLQGIKIACGGILFSTVLTLGKNIILISDETSSNVLDIIKIPALLICIACSILLIKFKINPILCIFIAAISGMILL